MTPTPVLKPISGIQLAPGSVLTVPAVSWDEFESILQELGEHRSARLAYSQGILEIVVPLPEHEIASDLISDIVKLLLKATGQRYQPFGSTTLKQEGSAGVEPDACFYIQHYQQMIGRCRLTQADPPPDLAIETDVTSKTTVEAYRAIAVPELWIYDQGQLNIYLFQDGEYVESATSSIFPEIEIGEVIPNRVERAWKVGNLQALEELEATLNA